MDQLNHVLCDHTIRRFVKFIITSRPHIPIASHLTDVIRLPLVAENLKIDIAAFVEAKVLKELQLVGSLGEEVQKALIDGANGMFLWVSLILNDLKNSSNTTPRAIRNTLKKLPPDLPGVYINIMRKIRKEDETAAQLILRWVVWALRPLRLQELTIAIAILPRHTSMSSMEDDMHLDMRRVLRIVFGPMLRIEDDDTVHLVHQSAKDFLVSMNTPNQGGVYSDLLHTFALSSAKSNLQLVTSCLAYLSFDECEDGPVTGEYKLDKNVRKNMKILKCKLPFLDYAATHWSEHARQADRSDDQILFRTFQKLADSRQK